MNQKSLKLIATAAIIIIIISATATFLILAYENNKPAADTIRIACVGDSLTQSSGYPAYLGSTLGTSNYSIGNFGAGSTTVLLNTETPYMNTSKFQSALKFQPNIVIVMLGTNDAQPNLKEYNASFVGDYLKLIAAFQTLSNKPQIYVVLPPPIFSNQSGKLDPDYFKSTIIQDIEQVAKETDLPIIDVYSVLANYPNYFPDGEHPNQEAAKLIANEIYNALNSKNSN
jgi:acyl-CoA thioesterase I